MIAGHLLEAEHPSLPLSSVVRSPDRAVCLMNAHTSCWADDSPLLGLLDTFTLVHGFVYLCLLAGLCVNQVQAILHSSLQSPAQGLADVSDSDQMQPHSLTQQKVKDFSIRLDFKFLDKPVTRAYIGWAYIICNKFIKCCLSFEYSSFLSNLGYVNLVRIL